MFQFQYFLIINYRKSKGESSNSHENSSINNVQNWSHSEGKSGVVGNRTSEKKNKGSLVFESSRHPADREDFEATGNETYIPGNKNRKGNVYGFVTFLVFERSELQPHY